MGDTVLMIPSGAWLITADPSTTKNSSRTKPAPDCHPASKTNTMKYLDLLKSKGTDSEKDNQFAHDAAQADLSLQSRLLATQQAVASAERKLSEAKSASPLNVDRIVELTNEVEDYKKGFAIITALKAELF